MILELADPGLAASQMHEMHVRPCVTPEKKHTVYIYFYFFLAFIENNVADLLL